MNTDEWMWLDARRTVLGDELARMCGVTPDEIGELVEYGSLQVLPDGSFRADVVVPLREAVRVRTQFDLDLFTAGLLLHYLQRIEHLEQELRAHRGHRTGDTAAREGPAPWREPHATGPGAPA
jgi:hypothetical protein